MEIGFEVDGSPLHAKFIGDFDWNIVTLLFKDFSVGLEVDETQLVK